MSNWFEYIEMTPEEWNALPTTQGYNESCDLLPRPSKWFGQTGQWFGLRSNAVAFSPTVKGILDHGRETCSNAKHEPRREAP